MRTWQASAIAFSVLAAGDTALSSAEAIAAGAVAKAPTIATPVTTTTQTTTCPGAFASPSHSVAAIMGACPEFASATTWETQPGVFVPYNRWQPAQIAQIQSIYTALWAGSPNIGVSCPNVASPNPTVYTEAQAFSIYAAHVAHVFYVEAAKRVPWSLLSIPGGERDELFNIANFFQRNAVTATGTDFAPGPASIGGFAAVCDPRDGYNFIRGTRSTTHQDLLGATPQQTLENLTMWLANNGNHGVGVTSSAIPIYLKDRLRSGVTAPARGVILPNGCHSGSKILQDLAQSVNIPLLWVGMGDHPYSASTQQRFPMHGALAFQFASAPLVLEHADDIYAIGLYPMFPIVPTGSGGPVGMASSGTAMRSASAQADLFFQTVWISPTVLTGWGFHFETGFPEVIPQMGGSDGAFTPPESPQAIRRSLGNSLGFWQPNPTHAEPSSDLSATLQYQLYKQLQLCSYGFYNQWWSPSRPGGSEAPYLANLLPSSFPGLNWATDYPVTMTATNIGQRLAACEQAWGGDAAIQTAVTAWVNRTANVWSD